MNSKFLFFTKSTTITLFLLCIFSYATNLFGQSFNVTPDAFNVTLNYGDSAVYDLQIANTTGGQLDYTIQGALTQLPQLKVLALINGAAGGTEYANEIAAINTYFDNYELTELSTYNPDELSTALSDKQLLLIPEQANCNAAGWIALAPVLQDFAQNGGTILLNGSQDGACIFNTGLFTGLYINFMNGNLNISQPDDPLLEGIIPPYQALVVTYYYNITNADAVRVLEYEGNDVVCYRNIGEGRAILIGHDYRFSNANMKRLAANVFALAAEQLIEESGNWLFISNNSGTLSDGQSETIPVKFKATDVFAGTYTQNLTVSPSNDLWPTFIIPCNMTVLGAAQYAVNTNTHDFGSRTLGSQASFDFVVTNNGSDVLEVLSVSSDNAEFSVSPVYFTINPGGNSEVLTVTYNTSSLGASAANIELTTNIGTFNLSVSGIGLAAPSAVVSPQSISETLPSGASTTVPLTIQNIGGNMLDFNISVGTGSGEPKILTYVNGIDLTGSYNNILSVLEEAAPNAQIVETSATTAAQLATDLADAAVFVIPAPLDLAGTSPFNTFSGVLQDYISQGGTVIFLGSLLGTDQHPALLSGIFSGSFGFPSGTACTVLDATHPITQGLPTNYTPTTVGPLTLNNPDIIRLVQMPEGTPFPFFGDGDIAAVRNIGSGHAIFLASEFSTYDNNDALLLSNAVLWEIGGASSWVSVSTNEGSVNFPNGSITIDVLLDATNIAPGVYTSQVIISTNDPANPSIIVPVTLTVTGNVPTAAFAANVTTTCNGVVQFNDQSVGFPTAWNWNFGDGTTSNQQYPEHTYTTDGIYSVTLEVCNAQGCNSTTLANYISVGMAPECEAINIPATGTQIIDQCTGTLTDSGGSGNYLIPSNGTITIAPAGATMVKITFTEFNYSSLSLPIPLPGFDHTLSIYDGTTTTAGLIGSYTGMALPNTSGEIISTGGAITLQENVAEGILGPASGFVATFECIVIDVPPVSNFTHTWNDPCAGEMQFTDNSANYPNSWTWNFGDGTTSNQQNPTHVFANNGTYTVTLNACNIVGCNEIVQTVTIEGLTVPNLNLPNEALINTPILLIDNTEGAIDWTWIFGNGNGANGINAPITFYTQPGTYTITVEITTSNGCILTVNHTINIVTVLSVHNPQQSALGFALSPNPAHDKVTLAGNYSGSTEARIFLYNTNGQLVYNQKTTLNGPYSLSIPVDNLAAGNYWVMLSDGKEYAVKQLLVK